MWSVYLRSMTDVDFTARGITDSCALVDTTFTSIRHAIRPITSSPLSPDARHLRSEGTTIRFQVDRASSTLRERQRNNFPNRRRQTPATASTRRPQRTRSPCPLPDRGPGRPDKSMSRDGHLRWAILPSPLIPDESCSRSEYRVASSYRAIRVPANDSGNHRMTNTARDALNARQQPGRRISKQMQR